MRDTHFNVNYRLNLMEALKTPKNFKWISLVLFSMMLFFLFFVPYPSMVAPAQAIESCVPIDFGNPPTAGSISVAGQVDCYTFEGVSGNIIRVDVEATSGTLTPYWQVVESDGTLVCGWSITSPAECTLVSSGTHTIMIKDFGDSDIGSYSLYVQRLNSPVGCTGMNFGDPPVAGSITLAAQEDCYGFSGVVGDVIRVDVEATSGTLTPYWQLVGPDGTVVCGWSITSPAECTLISSEAHTVMVTDFGGGDTGTYRLYIQRLNDPLKCITATYGGSAKQRAVNWAAQENCVRFNGNAGDQVKIYTFKISGEMTPYLQVIEYDGNLICGWSISKPSECILGSSGMHTIMVRDFGGTNKGKYYISICTDQTRCKQILTPPPVSYAGHDGWIRETSETSNRGGFKNESATTLRLGDSAARQQFRSILSFTTSSLPDDAVLTRVLLKVKKQGIKGSGNPVNIFRGFMVDLKKGYFNTSPILQSDDFQSRAGKSIGPFKPTLKSGWYTIKLTSAKGYVNKLVTKGGYTQIRLRFKLGDNNNSVANYLRLYSGNAAVESRPQLIIEYYIP